MAEEEVENARIASGLRILDDEIQALQGIRQHVGLDFSNAVELILALEGRVVTTGMGKAGIIAQKISATLASTGTLSIFLHPAEALHGDLGRVVSNDLLLALSKSGETDEILRLLAPVKAQGVKILAMTETKDSTLGRLADLVLELGPIDEAGPMGLAPSASTLAMLALGDALSLVVQEARDFGPEDFARFHPGGQLGRDLMQVQDIMRKGDRLPLVQSGTGVSDALMTMTETAGKPGAAIIVDTNGVMLGIFTDGDMRRHLREEDFGFLARAIDEIMTRTPKSVHEGKLVAEAMSILRSNKIDQLVVVDDDQHAIGMIDVQDILDFKV